jgi:hypothetical protein
MGFNVKSMTQDVHQGQFTITNNHWVSYSTDALQQ